jgi:glycosyl transferase family 2/tetratricopeptide repeat protein
MSDPRATLSLCMIVRDAERSLSAALISAQPFMDEMVIVDTGSVDRTRQIAQQFGAKLFDFVWCDDFSAARNYSLDQATGDWIFWMDTDDTLPADSGQELRRAIAECPSRDAAFWVTVEEEASSPNTRPARVMGHAHVKLFPRFPQIRFRYRVHEQVAPAIRTLGLPIKRTKAVVRHANADRSAQSQAARYERNLRLALLDLREHPDDPFVLLSVGTTYLFRCDCLPSAIEFLERSVAACPSGAEIQLNAYLYLGQALGTSGDRGREEQAYREALTLFPDDISLLLRIGSICERRQRVAEAAECYAAVLQRGRVRLSAVHVRGGRLQAALRLGELHLRMGQRARAERVWQTFLQRHPDAIPVRKALEKSYLHSCSFLVGPRQ